MYHHEYYYVYTIGYHSSSMGGREGCNISSLTYFAANLSLFNNRKKTVKLTGRNYFRKLFKRRLLSTQVLLIESLKF